MTCDRSCKSGACRCGGIKDGVLQPGHTMRLSLVDGKAPLRDERKPLTMMTDAEIKVMRDRVPSMTISEAAKLPIYDNVRGSVYSGHPAERYFAAVDGAKSDPADLQTIDRLASQYLYEQRLSNAWKG